MTILNSSFLPKLFCTYLGVFLNFDRNIKYQDFFKTGNRFLKFTTFSSYAQQQRNPVLNSVENIVGKCPNNFYEQLSSSALIKFFGQQYALLNKTMFLCAHGRHLFKNYLLRTILKIQGFFIYLNNVQVNENKSLSMAKDCLVYKQFFINERRL